MPERFESYGEFRRHLDALVRNGLIEDTTKIWWDIRPSSRYPTLETRVFDCCTHLDDAVCLAALNLSLVRMLYRLRRENKMWRRYPRMLIAENRWRAMRFGSDASLLDLARGELVPFSELLEELLAHHARRRGGARLPGGNRTRARAAQARHQRAPAGGRLPDRALAGRDRWRGACRRWSDGWRARPARSVAEVVKRIWLVGGFRSGHRGRSHGDADDCRTRRATEAKVTIGIPAAPRDTARGASIDRCHRAAPRGRRPRRTASTPTQWRKCGQHPPPLSHG